MMHEDEETLAFFFHIGLSITQWAFVERALLLLLVACYDEKDFELHFAEFYAVENFRSKLQMVDACLRLRFGQSKHFPDWHDLHLKATSLAKARNKLAHNLSARDGAAKPGRRSMLASPRSLKLVNKKPQNYPGALRVRDIAGLRQEFFALMISLENFRSRLLGRKEHFPKCDEQAQNPPTLHDLKFQIYALAKHPPRPSQPKSDKPRTKQIPLPLAGGGKRSLPSQRDRQRRPVAP